MTNILPPNIETLVTLASVHYNLKRSAWFLIWHSSSNVLACHEHHTSYRLLGQSLSFLPVSWAVFMVVFCGVVILSVLSVEDLRDAVSAPSQLGGKKLSLSSK